MKQTRIVILYGGKSCEHEVSLLSAGSIIRHLDADKYEAILVGIAKDGYWLLQDEYIARDYLNSGSSTGPLPLPLADGPRVLVVPGGGLRVESKGRLKSLPCDLVFPVLHGSFGEDGTIQGLLEVAGLAYVGAPVLGSAIGMDKEKAKELWLRAGLPVVPFLLVRRGEMEYPSFMENLGRKIDARFGWPVFVKPACAGSSVGASKVHEASALLAALRQALEWDVKAMVEPFLKAREIECSVIGNREIAAFVPGEILPTHEFYDYEAKYIDPDGARFEIPARISADQVERVKSVAIAAYKSCEMAGMARVDFFIEERTGEVLLNEINTIPGFTHISMFPKMCEAGGLPYAALIDRLAELALARHAERATLRFSR
jgi:D-alanine-D-alanine ligase